MICAIYKRRWPKVAHLHVSFTAYENFYKLSQNALSSHFVFHFLTIRCIKDQELNNQTYIHLYTGSLIHGHIYGDHFLVIFYP